MENCIEVKNLNRCYGNQVTVNNLNLTVKKGEVFGILGLKSFDNRSVRVLGMDPTRERERLFERVGVQLQSSSYQGNIWIGEVSPLFTDCPLMPLIVLVGSLVIGIILLMRFFRWE